MTAVLGIVHPLTAAKSSGSTSSILVIYAALAAAFYFLYWRPKQRRAKAAHQQGNAFDVGDEVLTAGGIVGHVIDIDDDRVTMETSVGASFVVLKQYVIRKLEAPSVDGEDDLDQDGGSGETDHHDVDDSSDDHQADDHDQEDGGGNHASGPEGKSRSTDGADGADEGNPAGNLDGPSII